MHITRSIESSHIRQMAFRCLSSLYQKLELKSRLVFFNYIHSRTDQSGLRGWIVTSFKDTFVLNLKNNLELAEYQGQGAKSQFRIFCQLSDGVQTDLIEKKEEILAILNSMHCIFRIDTENVTQIRDFEDELRESFLKVLQDALKISRAHYELQIKEFDGDKVGQVIVSGQELPMMNRKQAIEVMNGAINTLDLIHFNLAAFKL